MRHNSSLISLLLSALIFLSACGGGSSPSSGGGGNGGGGGSSNPTQVTATFSGPAPLVVADQIGTGSWTAATLQSSTLSLTIPAGTTTYGIAYLCPTFTSPVSVSFDNENIVYLSTSDPTSIPLYCNQTPTLGTISGNVDALAIPNARKVIVSAAQSLYQYLSSAYGPFSFSAQTGSNDIAAAALDRSSNVLAMKFARGQTVPGVMSSPITLTSADQTTPQTITMTDIPAGFNSQPSISAFYFTTRGTNIPLSGNIAATSGQYAVVSPSDTQMGDYYEFSVGVGNPSSSAMQAVGNTQTVPASPAPGNVSVPLPSPFNYVAPTPAALPTFTVSYTGFSNGALVSYGGGIQWSAGTSYESVTVLATAAYQNGATTLSIPDLSSVSGFMPALTSGMHVAWYALAYGGTYPAFTQTPASGTLAWAENNGSYTVP